MSTHYLARLCSASRQLSPGAEVVIGGTPDREDLFAVRVQVRAGTEAVIILETPAGPLDHALTDAATRLERLITRMGAASMGIEPDDLAFTLRKRTEPPPDNYPLTDDWETLAAC